MVSTRHMPLSKTGVRLSSHGAHRFGMAGFTLIEAMVSAIILTVGLLAISGMQSISLGRNVDASELSRVANLGADILERIQFNRYHAADYDNMTASAAATCPTSGIGPMAVGDCTQWRQLLLGSGLPNIQGQIRATPIITAPPLNQTQITVTLSWTGAIQSDTSIRRPKSIQVQAIVTPE